MREKRDREKERDRERGGINILSYSAKLLL